MRTVPMAEPVAQVLAALSTREHFVGDNDLVFCSETGGAIDGSAVRRRFIAARDAAKLRPIRMHDLRHTYGTTMARAGADIMQIRAWMGHAKIETTEVYLHYRPRGDEATFATRAFERKTGESNPATLSGPTD